MYELPRNTPAAGRLFKRSHALDGTMPVVFGPGTTPATLAGLPTDWRPANSLLTRPQVCYLSVGFPYSTDQSTWQWATTVSENRWRAEQLRIKQAMLDAKAIVEAARPGKTWVSVIEQTPTTIFTSMPTYTTDAGFRHLTPFVYPSADNDAYPCDFLHIYCGNPIIDDDVPDDAIPRATAIAEQVKPRVAAYHERAKKHAVIYPKINVGWPSDLNVGTLESRGFRFAYGSTAIYYDTENFDVVSANSYNYWDEVSNQQIDAMVGVLGQYGVQSNTFTTQVNADSLVATIAEFFEFEL